MNDLPVLNDTIMRAVVRYNNPPIKPGDLITFNITTLDQLTNVGVYSAPVSSSVPADKSGGLNLQAANTFLVNKQGEIEFPLVGLVKVSDMTLDDAKLVLHTKFSQFFKVFSLTLAFANHNISILGEISKPGIYPVLSDKVGLFDAIAAAGDITVYGKKENVLLIRDSSDGQKHIIRLNLNSKNILTSPYYYLKENDILYIEPSKAKLASTDAYKAQNLRIITLALTVAIIVISRLKIF